MRDRILIRATMALALAVPAAIAGTGPADAGRITADGVYALELAYPAAGVAAKLVDVRTGQLIEAGDAIAVSGDGRMLYGPTGARRDRSTGAVVPADLTAFGAVTSVSVLDASNDGLTYALQVRRPGQVDAIVLVGATGTAVAAPDLVAISPSGRYVAYQDRIEDRTGAGTVARARPDEAFGAVADDGAHIVADAATFASRRVVSLDGARRLTLPVFAEGGYQALSDDLTIGLLVRYGPAARVTGVWAVDLARGTRVPLAGGNAGTSLTAFTTWLLAGDGDTAVALTGSCDLTFTYCTYGPVHALTGLRDQLAAVPDAEPVTRLDGARTGTVPLTGDRGVPFGARAVLVNVTATRTAGPGFVTAWACGTDRPLASNLNYGTDATVANVVVAPLDDNGRTCLYSLQGADVVVDVFGWLGTGFQPERPSRLLDTRGGPAAAGTRPVQVPAGSSPAFGQPTTAVLNVTATEATADGFVTVWPCAQPRPLASNLYVERGDTRANLVVAPRPDDGVLCLYTNVAMHLVVDYAGAFAGDTGPTRTITSFAPTRLLDTRPGTALPAGRVTVVNVVSPDGGTASPGDTAVLTVTATEGTAPGYVTAYACGADRPGTSNLNHLAGQTIANTVFAPVGADGTVCLYNQSPVHLVVDLAATSQGDAPSSAYHAVAPSRVLDTRG